MKVALCLSGLARTFKKCYQSYIDNIISLYDCDVFVFVSKDANSQDMDLIKPTKSIIVENNPHLDEKNYARYKLTKFHSVQGFLQQFWKIEECHNLMLQYQKEKGIKYDWVIRSRPDVQIIRKLSELNELDHRYIYLPVQPYDLEKYRQRGQLDPNYVLPWQPSIRGLNTCVHDQFAIGSVELMTIYAKRYSNMDELIARGKDMFAEYLLGRQLEYNNVQVRFLPVPIISSPIRR